jgi:hypothetical protein
LLVFHSHLHSTLILVLRVFQVRGAHGAGTTGNDCACLQKDGPVHMTFTLLNRTAAESKPFDNVDAKFMATTATNDG